jgi:hypothetical protein
VLYIYPAHYIPLDVINSTFHGTVHYEIFPILLLLPFSSASTLSSVNYRRILPNPRPFEASRKMHCFVQWRDITLVPKLKTGKPPFSICPLLIIHNIVAALHTWHLATRNIVELKQITWNLQLYADLLPLQWMWPLEGLWGCRPERWLADCGCQRWEWWDKPCRPQHKPHEICASCLEPLWKRTAEFAAVLIRPAAGTESYCGRMTCWDNGSKLLLGNIRCVRTWDWRATTVTSLRDWHSLHTYAGVISQDISRLLRITFFRFKILILILCRVNTMKRPDFIIFSGSKE